MSWSGAVGNIKGPPGGVTETGTAPLVNGQSYIDVMFPSPQPDNNWKLVSCMITNTVDANALNLWAGTVVSKTVNGFRVLLSGAPDSINYLLRWNVQASQIVPATTYQLGGPTTGTAGVDSDPFTVNLPAGTTVATPVTITPNDNGQGGVFTPASVVLSAPNLSGTFKYRAPRVGPQTIAVTNNGGLTDPASIGFNAAAPPATTYLLSGPTNGTVGVASAPFTVQLPGGTTTPAAVTVTPHDGGAGGTFAPPSVVLSGGTPSATFTYTPSSAGTKSIATTNNGGLTDPSSLNYVVTTAPATNYQFSGPTGGIVGMNSTNFTVNLPMGQSVPSPVTVTPSDGGAGGVFTPATVQLTTVAPSATFVYSAASSGAKTISTTNNGGLTNPATLGYSATPAATTYILTGPTGGSVGTDSTPFTVKLPTGTGLAVPVTITPNDSGPGTASEGTFTPASVTLSTAAPSATFIYHPIATGSKSIATTNGGTLTDPAPLSYVAASPLMNGLVAYWKLDAAAGATRPDSLGVNNLTDHNTVGSVAGKVGNAASFDGISKYLSCPNNAALQMNNTSFTIVFWVKATALPATEAVLIAKDDPSYVAGTREYTVLLESDGSFNFYVFGPNLLAAKGQIATGNWVMVAAWFDYVAGQAHIRFYDAYQGDSGVASGSCASGATEFDLATRANHVEFFNGVLDEVGIWKRVLTPAEQTQLYNAGAGMTYPF